MNLDHNIVAKERDNNNCINALMIFIHRSSNNIKKKQEDWRRKSYRTEIRSWRYSQEY